jgi:DNA-binding transcriptional LysR family regulator
MNIHDIEAFLAVVDTGSISAAASRLNLTQPGVTRRIQNLETALGATLLDRQSKPLKPTGPGREAFELGRRVLRSVNDLKSGLAPDGEPGGEFRVGITPAMGDIALAEPIDAVRKAYPRLSLRVTSAWSPALMRQVASGALDAAAVLLIGEVEPPAPLQAMRLGMLDLIVVASRKLGLPRHCPLETVAGYPWILNPDGCGARSGIAALCAAAGLPFEIAVEAVGTELKLSLAARGIGLALLPPSSVAQSAFRDEVTTLRVAGLPREMNGWVVYPPLLGKLTAPVELLRDAFAASFVQAEKLGRRLKPRRAA